MRLSRVKGHIFLSTRRNNPARKFSTLCIMRDESHIAHRCVQNAISLPFTAHCVEDFTLLFSYIEWALREFYLRTFNYLQRYTTNRAVTRHACCDENGNAK